MATAILVCGRCGAEILADAPEGLCTACLFESGLGLLAAASVAAGADSGSAENVEPSDANTLPRVRKAQQWWQLIRGTRRVVLHESEFVSITPAQLAQF